MNYSIFKSRVYYPSYRVYSNRPFNKTKIPLLCYVMRLCFHSPRISYLLYIMYMNRSLDSFLISHHTQMSLILWAYEEKKELLDRGKSYDELLDLRWVLNRTSMDASFLAELPECTAAPLAAHRWHFKQLIRLRPY